MFKRLSLAQDIVSVTLGSQDPAELVSKLFSKTMCQLTGLTAASENNIWKDGS